MHPVVSEASAPDAVRVPLVPAPGSSARVINLSAGNTEDPEPDDVCMDNVESSDKFLADTAANRQVVANRHGFTVGWYTGR